MKNTLIQINSNSMGSNETELGEKLILKYLELLSQENSIPSFIVFYNEGVKLLCNQSKAIEHLELLSDKGTKLIACGTCLNFFNLSDKLKVGISGSMQDIISLQSKATKVITL